MIEFDEDMDEEWGWYDGQCCACDLPGRVDDLELCEECRTKLDPVTLWVLVRQRDWDCSAWAFGLFEYFRWRFDSRSAGLCLHGQIEASAFVGLRYDNPPGGHKTCFNTTLAACRLTLEQQGHSSHTFTTQHRAAFEILTDGRDHGVPVVVWGEAVTGSRLSTWSADICLQEVSWTLCLGNGAEYLVR